MSPGNSERLLEKLRKRAGALDSLGCDAVEFYGFCLAGLYVCVQNSKPWSIDHSALVDFEEFGNESVYVSWAREYS